MNYNIKEIKKKYQKYKNGSPLKTKILSHFISYEEIFEICDDIEKLEKENENLKKELEVYSHITKNGGDMRRYSYLMREKDY